VLSGKDSVIVDAATGEHIAALPLRLDAFDQVAFDPTAQFLVVLSDAEKTVLIFDAETGARVPPPEEPWFYPFGFGPVDFTADGTRFLLLKSGQDTSQNGFDLYETASGRLLHQQVVGDGNASPGTVVFGPGDRTILATVGNEIFVYDATSHETVSRMAAPGRHVAALQASADGNRIVAGLSSGTGITAEIVAMPFHEIPGARVVAARRLAPRCLTPEERRETFMPPEPPRWCITGPGLEETTDPSTWQPLYPYGGTAWRQWLTEREAGRAPALPD
jgi:hypothetical protein